MPRKNEIIFSGEYVALLSDIKKRIISARIKAARSVNKELIRLYWEIGKLIAEKQVRYGWGQSVWHIKTRQNLHSLCKKFRGVRILLSYRW